MINFKPRRKGYRALHLMPDGKTVSVEVDYELGGANYFSGQTNRRGVYVYLRHINVTDRGESFMVGEGFKVLIQEQKRRNDQATGGIAAVLDDKTLDIATFFHNKNDREATTLIKAPFVQVVAAALG